MGLHIGHSTKSKRCVGGSVMAAEWFVRIADVEHGPISSEALKQLAFEGQVTSELSVKKGASGNWVPAGRVKGLFASTTDQISPPPMPQARPPMPKVTTVVPSVAEAPASSPRFSLDTYQIVLLSVGAVCLLVLAISPFFNWVTIFAGGVSGIQGDGKIVAVISLVIGVLLGIELAFNKRAVTSVLLAQAWGTVAALWMVGEVLRVGAFAKAPEMRDNPFGLMLVTQVGPGAGLFLGMIGGIGLAVAFGILTFQFLKTRYVFAGTQTLSVLIGIGIAMALGSPGASHLSSPEKPKGLALPLLGVQETHGVHPDSPHIRLGQTITLDQVKVTPQKLELRRIRSKYERDEETPEPVLVLTVLVENISKGQVFAPHASAKAKDNFGNELEKVGGRLGSFFPEGSAEYDDLKPGQQAIVILCIEPKIDTAQSYQWEISQTCNNSKDDSYRDWVLTFDATEISRSSQKAPFKGKARGSSPAAAVDEWTDAKSPVRQGSVTVQVTGVVIGMVPVKSIGGDMSTSKDQLCQISLRITNVDSARKIDYHGWQGNTFSSDATLTDDLDNRYKGVSFGFGDKIVGQVRSESIYPGGSVDDLLVFEAPIDAAKYLNLELPASNFGGSGKVYFRISRGFSQFLKDKAVNK